MAHFYTLCPGYSIGNPIGFGVEKVGMSFWDFWEFQWEFWGTIANSMGWGEMQIVRRVEEKLMDDEVLEV